MPEKESQNAIEIEELKFSIRGIIMQNETTATNQGIILANIENVVKATLEQAKKTNGRVTELENETSIIRLFKKHKYVLALVLIGFFKIYEMIPLNELFNKLLKLIF